MLVGKNRSHEFRVEATFDHLEGEQSYEPYDAADFIYLASTFSYLPPTLF